MKRHGCLLWSAPAERSGDGALARSGQTTSGSAIRVGYSNPKRCRARDHCPTLATAVQDTIPGWEYASFMGCIQALTKRLIAASLALAKPFSGDWLPAKHRKMSKPECGNLLPLSSARSLLGVRRSELRRNKAQASLCTPSTSTHVALLMKSCTCLKLTPMGHCT